MTEFEHTYFPDFPCTRCGNRHKVQFELLSQKKKEGDIPLEERRFTHFVICPETGHPLLINLNPNYEMDFSEALRNLKSGNRIARKGWNGKGMFLFILPANDGIPKEYIKDPHLKSVVDEFEGDTFDALGSIRMFTADKKILTGWVATQTDMLANDWRIVPS